MFVVSRMKPFAADILKRFRPSLKNQIAMLGIGGVAIISVTCLAGLDYAANVQRESDDSMRFRAQLSELSDEDLRAAVVAGGDPIDILVKTPLLPVFGINIALIAARSQGILLCGTFLADRSCPVV